MRTVLNTILLLFLAFHIFGQNPQLKREIGKLIRYETQLEIENHPGLIIGVIVQDSQYIIPFGNDSISKDDLFELGGLSKVFTSYLVLHLARENKINLNARINDLLGKEFQNAALKEYTITDLLRHQVPFPKRPSDLSKKEYIIGNPYAYYSKADLLAYYKNFKISKYQKKARLYYSHITYALLEIIIEKQTGKSYKQNLDLFLKDQFSLMQTSANSDSMAYLGFNTAGLAQKKWDFQSFTASEGIHSNLNDLMHFYEILNSRDSGENKLITEAYQFDPKDKVSKNLYRNKAWYILKSKRIPAIYTHTGSTGGNRASMSFCPETSTAVIILSRSDQEMQELGLQILRMINYNWKKRKHGKKE